jgi:predicted nucleotide-binding protein (sugar kinase/HSP70/actin superfamily)
MHELNLADLRESLATGDLGAALERCASRMAAVEVDRTGEPRPLVGVAGDIYTRINPWANRRLFWSLERLGCEVWPAPFLVDLVDHGLLNGFRRSLRRPLPGLLFAGFALMLQQLAGRFVRRGLRRASWREEPDPDRYQQLARRYVGDGVNLLVQWNVAKMVDYATRGADGIINAVGENCMAGTVSAAITRRIRRDHGGIPLITPYYGVTESDAEQTALEAFVHQTKRFRARRSECAKS